MDHGQTLDHGDQGQTHLSPIVHRLSSIVRTLHPTPNTLHPHFDHCSSCLGSACGVNSPSVARICCSLPPRLTVNVTSEPGPALATWLRNVFGSLTSLPLKAVMTSSFLSPARSAALPDCTWTTATPFWSCNPRRSAISELTFCTVMPSCPRRTLPLLINVSITTRAMFDGTAKPIPMLPPEGESICELMPTNSLLVLTRAPPELP